jgi:glycosyltransferase involved in cell wall biosynthesis
MRAIKENLRIPGDARVLLYVGRLAKEKNLDLLLDAFAQILSSAGNVYLVIAGSGNNAARLKGRTEQLCIDEFVRYTGFLDRTRLDPLYKAADVFVYPSMTETQGLAVGEALAAGTPCVVVNGGGAPETVTNGVDGFTVRDDVQEFASAVLKLLDDDILRRKFSEAGRRNAERLRPERVAQLIVESYEDLVAGGKPRKTVEPVDDDVTPEKAP